jgi:hypothetical protein
MFSKRGLIAGVLLSLFATLVTVLFSDPIHGLIYRSKIALPVIPVWFVTGLTLSLVIKNMRASAVVLSVLLLLIFWSCRLDYAQINRVSIYGLPLALLVVFAMMFVIKSFISRLPL